MFKFIVAIAETLLETSNGSHVEIVRAVESARKVVAEHTDTPIHPRSSIVQQAVEALSRRKHTRCQAKLSEVGLPAS